jgi:hypothetical protein
MHYTINILFADDFADLLILVIVNRLHGQLEFCGESGFKCARGSAGGCAKSPFLFVGQN